MTSVTVTPLTSWQVALNLARKTVGKPLLDKEPSAHWKYSMLLAEHSPIRVVTYILDFSDIKQWVTTHFVRHWLGFIPFVHSQREDRRQLDVPRDELPQGSLNDMSVHINAQSLINVSRKRLCSKASSETRLAWTMVKDQMTIIDPPMAAAMVPECIYRGFCTEPHSCGFINTYIGQAMLKEYRTNSFSK